MQSFEYAMDNHELISANIRSLHAISIQNDLHFQWYTMFLDNLKNFYVDTTYYQCDEISQQEIMSLLNCCRFSIPVLFATGVMMSVVTPLYVLK